jgi:hypothetical protein
MHLVSDEAPPPEPLPSVPPGPLAERDWRSEWPAGSRKKPDEALLGRVPPSRQVIALLVTWMALLGMAIAGWSMPPAFLILFVAPALDLMGTRAAMLDVRQGRISRVMYAWDWAGLGLPVGATLIANFAIGPREALLGGWYLPLVFSTSSMISAGVRARKSRRVRPPVDTVARVFE